MFVLTVNPGSTSTKVALYRNGQEILRNVLRYSKEQLEVFQNVYDQLQFRLTSVLDFIEENEINTQDIQAVVGRGGLLNPMPSGTYFVNERMKEHLKIGVQGQHESNLGGLIAAELANRWQAQAFIVDPVAVDEMIPEARISGIPQIERKCLSHALNIKAVSHRYAQEHDLHLNSINLIVVHLGGGISVVPLKNGNIIDVNNANDMGPFSPERAGTVPAGDLVKLCFSNEYSDAKSIKRTLTKKSGLIAYLGTNNLLEVESSIANGNKKTQLIWDAMAYQIAKEIGRMATVLHGDVKSIILTGGLANSVKLTQKIMEYVSFIAPLYVYPGEDELQALADGAYRVLSKQEEAKDYIY